MTDHTPIRPLTDRQQQIAELVGDGFTYSEIAAMLRISPTTVKHHIEAIVMVLPTIRGVSARWRVRFFVLATRQRVAS